MSGAGSVREDVRDALGEYWRGGDPFEVDDVGEAGLRVVVGGRVFALTVVEEPAGEPAAADAGERELMWEWRQRMLALMIALAFAGGALFGLLASAFGLPPVWWSPLLLALTCLMFWVLTRRDR